MLIAGIDVGFSGAIALIQADDMLMTPHIVSLQNMPVLKTSRSEINLQEVVNTLSHADHVFIERAQTMPGQGISSSGRYMESYGMLQGICAALKIPYELVTPQRWKKAMMPDAPKDKEASMVFAMRRYPELQFKFKKDHGKADSLLLATYGWYVLKAKK
jgi:crossover junction endodeoxyribonuclease RuvC